MDSRFLSCLQFSTYNTSNSLRRTEIRGAARNRPQTTLSGQITSLCRKPGSVAPAQLNLDARGNEADWE